MKKSAALLPLLSGILAITPIFAETPGKLLIDEPRSWEHEPSPYVVPQGLVKGAAFIDRILPMPDSPNGLRSDVWGAPNTKPRNVENGIEDPAWSFWCRSVFKDPSDGKYHLFGARWPENNPKGFDGWPGSRVYHAVSDSPTGPFKVVEQDIGRGHNVTTYRAKDGTYVIGTIDYSYVGKSVFGPWTRRNFSFDSRGSYCPDMSNNTYVSRPDGSVLMINQPGRVWVSEDGLKPFRRVTDSHGGHPYTLGIFEDPIIWRDEVQYNVIFNDWYGRTAYYLRSKDGVNWVWDQGIAYGIDFAKHSDGSVEHWYKYERPSVLVDEYGRATTFYAAVLGTRKDLDKGGDGNTTKNIALPLVVQRRLEILNTGSLVGTTDPIRVRIKAEPGFDPLTQVNVKSLRFGAPSAVDFGKGLPAASSAPDGADLVVTFARGNAGFTEKDFAGKLLGEKTGGGLLFGFSRLPGVSYDEPILNAVRPALADKKATFLFENFGMCASASGKVTLRLDDEKGTTLKTEQADLPAIPAYGNVSVALPLDFSTLAPGRCVTAHVVAAGGGTPFTYAESFQNMPAAKEPFVTLPAPKTGRPSGPLMLADSAKNLTFRTGFTAHAPGVNTWFLDGSSYNWFTCRIGPAKNSLGGATVEVWGDGRRLYASSLLRPKSIYQECHDVVVPVKGVRKLTLVTNAYFAPDKQSESADHVVFGDPKLHTGSDKPKP